MAKENIKAKKGFTIIEVVLVLAIAGLIFLMVFVALPALQRSQRDTQRRDDMGRFISQLAQYQTNNNGNVPSDYADFISKYLKAGGDSFVDPSGAEYTVTVTDCTNESTCKLPNDTTNDYTNGTIRLYTNATCNGESPSYSKGSRKIAITYKLEGAGTYCGHN